MNIKTLLLGILLSSLLLSGIRAQDTAITYQGELKQNGSLVNGLFQIEFSLYDEPIGGNFLAGLSLPAVSVAEGRFTAELDFGSEVFATDALKYLEIVVEGSSLTPRTLITNAPMAIQTRGIFVDVNEEIGLGTTNPAARLDVVSDTLDNGNNTARFSAPGLGPNISHVHFGLNGDWFIRSAADFGKIVIQDNPGAIGFGTSTPFSDFKVTVSPETGDGGISAVTNATDLPSINAFNLGTGPVIYAQGIDDTNVAEGGLIIVGLRTQQNLSIDANEIMARDNGSISTLLLNREGGNVAIGSASGGTSVLSAPVMSITGGSDLAEMFDVGGHQKPLPGMVVVIDSERPGGLTPSTSPYDQKVAGIISGAGGVSTGMTMGHDGTIADGDYPVALSGRVYCLVDASTGSIEPGDMLTTSARPGYAMKVVDMDIAHGAIIGKAMTGIEAGGSGLILVLVNLQ